MNSEELVSMFDLAQDRKLSVTMTRPWGEVWLKGIPVVVKTVPGREDESIVSIVPIGNDDYYIDFPVSKVCSDDGSFTLEGEKGKAAFQVRN